MNPRIDHKEPFNSSTTALFELYRSLAQDHVNPYVQVGNACPKERIHELSPFLFFLDDLKSHAETIAKTYPEIGKAGAQLLENSEYRFAREILRKRYDVSLPAGKFLSYVPGINWLSVKPDWRDNFTVGINFKFRGEDDQVKTIILGNKSDRVEKLDYDLSFLQLFHQERSSILEGEVTTKELLGYLQSHSIFVQISGKETLNIAFAKDSNGSFQLAVVSDNRGMNNKQSFLNENNFPKEVLEIFQYLISDSTTSGQSSHKRKNRLKELLGWPYEGTLGKLAERIGKAQSNNAKNFFIARGINDLFLMGYILREPRPKATGTRPQQSNVIRFSFPDKNKADQFFTLLDNFFAKKDNNILTLLQSLMSHAAQDYLIRYPITNDILSNMIPDGSYNPEINVQLTEKELDLLNQPLRPVPNWLRDLGVATIVSTSE